jgi:heptosyltransferase-2
MTPDQPSTATSSRIENEPPHSRTPALIVRISAIGDTLIAARTQGQLYSRGYTPVLVTHKNNSTLLNCMPLLQGACLISDHGPEFLWRQENSEKLDQVSENDFLSYLKATLQKSDPRKNQNDLQLSALDLQNTARSVRAIRELEPRFARAGLKIEKRKVAKLSFWRLLLVFLSFFARSQRPGRKIPAWLHRRLKPVHQLQKELVQTLPVVPMYSQPNPSNVLIAPPQTNAHNLQGHVVFLVGASLRLKSWPKEHYRALQNMIIEHTAFSVVLCGGPEDVRVGEYLAFPEHERIINKIGKTTLAETLSLIRTAKYVVTGDSFASHAADLLGTPASVMFGSTHPLLGFAPQGAHVSVHHAELACSPCSRHGQGECRFKNMRCLTSIKPEEVFSKIEQISKTAGQRADSLRQSSDS